MTELAQKVRDEFLTDPKLLARHLTKNQRKVIRKKEWTMQLFFGTALEKRVALLAKNDDILSNLKWTGTTNASQDFYRMIGKKKFGFDITGGSRSSVLKHTKRKGIDAVITYDSIPSSFGYDWLKMLKGVH